ncbi:MAG TPA: hypothetical protein VF712_14070 [Thermoleophilaceae bacterium]|jgi:hypothetical protein
MSTSTPRPHRSPSPYSVYPLEALDGVLAYVALDGETIAYCFGSDERAAAEAVAARVTELGPRSQPGADPAEAHAPTGLSAAGDRAAAREASAEWASSQE